MYKTVVRPPIMYGDETWAVKKAQENKLNIVEVRMCGVTKLHRISNERGCEGERTNNLRAVK